MEETSMRRHLRFLAVVLVLLLVAGGAAWRFTTAAAAPDSQPSSTTQLRPPAYEFIPAGFPTDQPAGTDATHAQFAPTSR
jgi:hypothetical protein